jgi:hypothetical protein
MFVDDQIGLVVTDLRSLMRKVARVDRAGPQAEQRIMQFGAIVGKIQNRLT